MRKLFVILIAFLAVITFIRARDNTEIIDSGINNAMIVPVMPAEFEPKDLVSDGLVSTDFQFDDASDIIIIN